MEFVTYNGSVLGTNTVDKNPCEHVTAIGFDQGRHGYPVAKPLYSWPSDSKGKSVSSPGVTSPGEDMDLWEFLRQGG